MSDDMGLDEDLDSSEVGSRASVASRADTPTLASEFDSPPQDGAGHTVEKSEVCLRDCFHFFFFLFWSL